MSDNDHADLALPLFAATKPGPQCTRWEARETTWGQVLSWAEEAPAAPAKDQVHGYVLGTFKGARRKKETVLSRAAVTLDADHLTAEGAETLLGRVAALGWEALVHETVSSSEDDPRFRIVLPTDRPVTPDEYRLAASYLNTRLGEGLDSPKVNQETGEVLVDEETGEVVMQPALDPTSAEPERFMYRPAQLGARSPWHVHHAGPLLPVAQVLCDAMLEAASQDSTEGDGEPSAPAHRRRGEAGEPLSTAELMQARRVLAKATRLIPLGKRPGGQDAPGRNVVVYSWLPTLFRFVQADGDGGQFTREAVEEAVWEAVQHHPPSDNEQSEPYDLREFKDQCRKAWREAQSRPDRPRVDELGPLEPEDAPPPAKTAPAKDKDPDKPSNVVLMCEFIRDQYSLFPAGDDSRVYALPRRGGRAELLTPELAMRVALRVLGLQAATLSTQASEAVKQLTADAADNPPRRLALRADYNAAARRIVLDLGDPQRSTCVVVTPDGWSVQPQPPDDVTFRAALRPLPVPVPGTGDLDALRRVLRWDADDQRWLLVRGWLPAALLSTIGRPLLGFFGPKGSGKTDAAWMVVSVLEPKSDNPLAIGSRFAREQRNDEVRAQAHYLPCWDNVDDLTPDQADFLSRLVTGEDIETRMLYSNADMFRVSYRRTGALTGLTRPGGLKSDSQDRLIVINMTTPETRLRETTLVREWQQAHPAILAGVLDAAVGMLAAIDDQEEDPAGKRMADYVAALSAMGPGLRDAYVDSHTAVQEQMAEEDPFVQALVTALQGQPERTVRMKPSDMYAWASLYRPNNYQSDWPRNARAFSARLTTQEDMLRSVGVTWERRKSDGTRMLVLHYSGPELGDE